MKNVLLVDDNKHILNGLAEYLRLFSNGFNVVTAEDGGAAMSILKSGPIDIVVTDLSMPVISGYQLLAYTRENFPSIPVVAMTAQHSPQVEMNLRSMGVSHCIRKHDVRELASKLLDKLSASSACPN
ncbi:MAG TPA: response regulator [Thermodesulfovibrionales bacterium]|nr:response regulator [Thermodesulfovibrionales bacterium]